MGSAWESEERRLAELAGHQILDTDPEEGFDDLTTLAAQLCHTPMALISLVDRDRLWFKSRVGVEVPQTPRDSSFCAHALGAGTTLVVPDALADPCFSDNPLVTGDPWIRFYAGVPLSTDDGLVLGTLCVLDTAPRTLTARQLGQLTALARQVMAQLRLRRKERELTCEVIAGRLAGQALAESGRLLHGVLDHTDALIYAKDLTGRYTLVNRMLEAVLERPAYELIGARDHELFPAGMADDYRQNDTLIATVGSRHVFGEQLRHADGSIHDYLSTKFPLRNEDGVVYAVGGVSTDVTELAAHRWQLVESEQRWRSLVEHSPVAVAVIGADARFAYANPRALALYGTAEGPDLIGYAAHRFVPEGAEVSTAELFASVLAGTTVTGRRWTLRRLGGALVPVEINAARVEYAGTAAVQIELRDMTAQDEAEGLVRRSEQRWRALFTGSPVGIAVADEQGTIVTANAALCAFLGRPEAEVVGHTSAEFSHPDDRPTELRTNDLIRSSPNGVARLERRYLRPDGRTTWAWLTVTHTPGPDGSSWTLAHLQDITDRKAVEAAAAASAANLAAMAEVARQIQSDGDARQTIVDAGLQLAGASYVSLLEPDVDGAALRVTATTSPHLLDVGVSMSTTSATASVFRTGRPLFLADPATHPLVSPTLLELTGSRSIHIVPVVQGRQVTAVMIVAWAERVPTLDDDRVTVITLLADQAAVALRQVRLISELEALALTDPLTGLPNRRGWDRLLADSLDEASRSGAPLTVALADLDHFKRYNDTRGHPAGDELLRRLGASARRALRRGDTAVRWGGEEFGFALPDCSPDEAVRVLSRVLHAVPDGETCSIGFATWDGRESPGELVARADGALYRAKQSGRNQVLAAALPQVI